MIWNNLKTMKWICVPAVDVGTAQVVQDAEDVKGVLDAKDAEDVVDVEDVLCAKQIKKLIK